MALELVIGYQGKDHVTAEQWADFNRGIFGEAAILPVGNRMETAIQTANQITVKDGVAVFDGREVYIGYGETENIAITSGTQGMLRRDIVVVEYTREEETGIESVQFKVINGTPAASNAKDPSVQDMDIRTGVFVSQKPFCRVRLNGTAIEGVDSLVSVKEFKNHAFADPVNNLTGTDPSLPLAAPQGKKLKQQVDQLDSALGDLKFTRQVFNNVSTDYSDDNRIRYNGDVINAETFPSSVWLIVLNGTETTGAGSMFLALVGTETPKMKIVELGKNSDTYPVLRATETSGLLYVAWSNTRNAYMAANVFKLS